MEKGKFFSGLFIMLGLIFLGLMIPRAVSNFRDYDRVVYVKGLSEREVKADKVIWPLTFKVMSNDISALYDQIDRNTEKVVDFLLDGGISRDEISVSVPSVSDKLAQEYGNNDRAFRYVSNTVITVCTHNVDLVVGLMGQLGELMKSGVMIATSDSWENRLEFNFEGLNDIKPEMIEEATKNAREAALKFAKDSGSKLGKIKTANQGTFTISDRDSNTPYIKRVRVVSSVTYYLNN